MTERLLITLTVVAASAALWLALRGYLHLLRARARVNVDPESVSASDQTPTLMYLYTEECVQCRQQARAVAAVELHLADRVAVRRVNALAEPDLADRLGIWTVPATVVLDAAGRASAVNSGLTSSAQLERQVLAALGQRE